MHDRLHFLERWRSCGWREIHFFESLVYTGELLLQGLRYPLSRQMTSKTEIQCMQAERLPA
jgi:hypothetical protein